MTSMITRLTILSVALMCLCPQTVFGQEVKNEQRAKHIKPEIRRVDPIEFASRQRLQEITTRADVKPFPDSTVTFDLKGTPIAKEFYLYNEKGNQISYKAYKKDAAGNWYETARSIVVYSAGRLLSDESMSWDEATKSLAGNYKYAYTYNSSGGQTSYEYYIWDYQKKAWKCSNKTTYDYVNGNQRRSTSYELDKETGELTPTERTVYVSETVLYEEYWNSVDQKWGSPWKVETKRVIDHDQSGLDITITEEKHTIYEGLEDEYTYTFYRYSSWADNGLTGWQAWDYVDYTVSYDDAGNITNVSLIDGGGSTFSCNFTYDYAIGKINSAKIYENGILIDDQSCIYDAQGRVLEMVTHYNNQEDEMPKVDTKYTYTYVGDSETRNSTEYYLWDESKRAFVSQSKDMYIRNANEQNTMHQIYSWAETKWVLSSYTIYYPNEYTSDLEIEESGAVGSDNKGSFYITFPKGFVLDEENTVLSEALRGKYAISVRKENDTTWFVEIMELTVGSRSLYAAASSYKNILTVAYRVDEETKQGEYSAEITNLNFVLTDGTVLIEQQRDVTVTVGRYGVANEEITEQNVSVFLATNMLTIEIPDAETIYVYRISGELIHSASKATGTYTVATGEWPKGVTFTGISSWVKKVLIE